MGTSYRLILQSGVGAGTEYPLEKTELQLGRDLANDIVINDPEVSRRHAHLTLQADNYILEDLGSTNGTFIRGQRLGAPVVLRPGETITIGEKVVLKYEVITTDPNATVVVQRRPVEAIQPPVTPVPIPPAPQPIPASVRTIGVQPSVPPTMVQPPVPIGPPGMTPPPVKKKKSKALTVILVLLGIILVFCVIPTIIVDLTNSWCSIFGWVFKMFGACL